MSNTVTERLVVGRISVIYMNEEGRFFCLFNTTFGLCFLW